MNYNSVYLHVNKEQETYSICFPNPFTGRDTCKFLGDMEDMSESQASEICREFKRMLMGELKLSSCREDVKRIYVSIKKNEEVNTDLLTFEDKMSKMIICSDNLSDIKEYHKTLARMLELCDRKFKSLSSRVI